MSILARAAAVLFIVALPVLLVTSNVRILATEERFYERGFRKYDAEETTRVPLSELDRAARAIIDYFTDDADTLHILVTQDGREISLFNERETEHMEDVKGLMRLVFRLNEWSLAYVLAYITCAVLWTREGSLQSLARRALMGMAAGFTVVVAVGATAAAGFDRFWTRFHELAFRNDLWQLSPERDRLIQMFPERFWEESTFILAGMMLAEAALIAGVSLAILYLRPEREEAERSPAATALPGIRPGR
jgi:integral membrane protein (TIGR01906 family)